MKKKPGFTILELIITLAIVGVLAAVAAYAINTAREAQRDADRISDVSVLRSGLSQYWLRSASFPVSEGVLLGSPDSGIAGLSTEGFVGSESGGNVILEYIPTGPKRNEFYMYKGNNNGYSIQFTTERDSAYGEAGTYYAHVTGVDQDDVIK